MTTSLPFSGLVDFAMDLDGRRKTRVALQAAAITIKGETFASLTGGTAAWYDKRQALADEVIEIGDGQGSTANLTAVLMHPLVGRGAWFLAVGITNVGTATDANFLDFFVDNWDWLAGVSDTDRGLVP